MKINNSDFQEYDWIKYLNIDMNEFKDIQLKAKWTKIVFIIKEDWIYLDHKNIWFSVKFKKNFLKVKDINYWNLDEF